MINYGYIRTSKLTNNENLQKEIINNSGFDNIEYIIDNDTNEKLFKILDNQSGDYRIIVASEICLSGSFTKRIQILKKIQQNKVELICGGNQVILNSELFDLTDYISKIESLRKKENNTYL